MGRDFMALTEHERNDPIAELATILEQESLESRFQRLLVSVFRRICDGGYYSARDLLDIIERAGAIAFVQDWLRDERAQPSLDLLCNAGRVDLAIEWLVPRVPYCRLFTDEEKGAA